MAIAEKLRQKVATEHFPGPRQVTIGVGVGVPHAGDDNQEASVRRADTALYQAKRAGRNRVCCEGQDGQGAGSGHDNQ